MSRSSTDGRKPLARLADMLAEDILNATDEEILKELTDAGEDPDRLAAEMRELFDKSALKLNKGRMAAAKAGVNVSRQFPHVRIRLDPIEARHCLRVALGNPNVPPGLTLAARNESELSDADILGMLEDLRELGFLPEDDVT